MYSYRYFLPIFAVFFIWKEKSFKIDGLQLGNYRSRFSTCTIERNDVSTEFRTRDTYLYLKKKKVDLADDNSHNSALFESWSQICLKSLNITEKLGLNPIEIPGKFKSCKGVIGRDKTIEFSSVAYKNDYFDYMRLVSFNGSGYAVMNLVILPNLDYNLPIFGVDVVSLPGKFTLVLCEIVFANVCIFHSY